MAEDTFMPPEFIRRFPVYLLLDCSGSMHGEPITVVSEGLDMIYYELMEDPEATERVFISVITFAEQAEMEPLVPIDEFVPPTLMASGHTAMGAAFAALVDSIEKDLIKNDSNRKGDYRPLVFLLTDGIPSDNYKDEISRLKALKRLKPTIVALGCGPETNKVMLHEVTEHVFLMHEFEAENLRSYFRWVSSAIIRLLAE